MTETKVSDDTLAYNTSPHKDKFVTDNVSQTVYESEEIDIEKRDEREEDENQYPNTKIVAIVMLALYLAMYLVALVCCSSIMKTENSLTPAVG